MHRLDSGQSQTLRGPGVYTRPSGGFFHLGGRCGTPGTVRVCSVLVGGSCPASIRRAQRYLQELQPGCARSVAEALGTEHNVSLVSPRAVLLLLAFLISVDGSYWDTHIYSGGVDVWFL